VTAVHTLPARRLAALAGVVLLGAVLLAPVARAYLPAPYGGAVAAPLADQPVSLDPARACRESELQLASLLYDPLFVLGPDGRPRPHLAFAPEISPDGRTWRLGLRPGALAGGRPLGAADAAASLRRLKRGPNGYLLAPVREIEVDGSTLVLKLSRPTPTLGWLLSAPAASITSLQNGQPVGSGPFRLQRRTPGSLLLRANGSHFAGRPYLDELRLNLYDRAATEVATFQVGAIQLSFSASSYSPKPRHPTAEIEGPLLSLVYLGVGRGGGPSKSYLADPQFRQALLLGIDRKRLGRLATTGRADIAVGPVPAQLLRPSGRGVPFDRAAAMRQLARLALQHPALRADSAGGRLKLSLLVDATRLEDAVAAGQLVADLDRLGIAASLESRPADEYRARLEEGRYDLVLARQAVQVPLGPVLLAGALALGGERAAAQRCLATGPCGAREAAQFMKRLPLIPLVHTARRAFHDARLAEVRLGPRGLVPYADLYWARKVP
jgi:MarR-like DNA-binding transcriptional regulator SgrR of sgrS sRNA